MGLISKVLSKNLKTQKEKRTNSTVYTAEYSSLLSLDNFLKEKLNEDHYVARSEYFDKVKSYQMTIDFFKTLVNGNMLSEYCNKNGIDQQFILSTIDTYENIEKIIKEKNKNYVNRKLIDDKDYLDNILKDVDPNILLDENQRRVVLTDEDHCLVIAGAGAGKTTTVAAKVKYLVDMQGIDPSKILVVSFTNKAVNELKKHINKQLGIECPIATFHATGNAILHKKTDEKLNIADNSTMYRVLQSYFMGSVLQNESTVNNLILFFSSYFDAPYEGNDLNNFFNNIAKSNFATMRSELNDFKLDVIDRYSKKAITIQNEVLRSYEEVRIANFLYLNNINYEYEPLYKYDIEGATKPYTPDFRIWQGDLEAYVEHFGITESGENDRYSKEELETYKKAVNDKIAIHKQHGTTLLHTFSKYNDGIDFITHLNEQLVSAGFELKPRSNKEVMEKLVLSEESRYIKKLVFLLCRFITNFKINGYTNEDFDRMYASTQNVRTRLFLNICQDCFLEYEKYLKNHSMIDFQDMINDSAKALREIKEIGQKVDFDYIIVDEYQDISFQRFDLVSALSDTTNAKIIAVGDDWQSIYAFSGSDISLFTDFAAKVGYAEQMKIVNTYRNSQEIIDIAGGFIQRNPSQIQKDLVSPKHIDDPIIIYTYNATYKKKNSEATSGANYEMAHAVEMALDQIVENYSKESETTKPSVLLLGRYGFDGDNLGRSVLFNYNFKNGRVYSVKYPDLPITFMTAHSSKGLGYDNVIIINARNETYGFPSKIQDDPVLSFVIKGDRSINYAEERRLFYVAMTRTKNRVYIISPEKNPSEFLLELKSNYKNVVLKGEWNDEPYEDSFNKKLCPICGYPMIFRYKPAYGLKLYMCTNEPEICGFMTNQYAAGKLAIQKCGKCRDGYLIVKPGNNGDWFLGCTNYKKDKTGCNNSISRHDYYVANNYKIDWGKI